ncbi:MAG: hypothetical protein ABL930_10090 [Pseudobdellovibrio sp.]
MKNLFLCLIFVLASITAFTDSIKPVEFPDQFDTKTAISENTQWLIFSEDKDISDKVNQAIVALKITDVNSLKGAYVADISKMPSLVTSMFALPEMKKYNFKILLDHEGEPTKNWPRQTKKASLIKLTKLEIAEVKYTDSIDEIKKFLQQQMLVKK